MPDTAAVRFAERVLEGLDDAGGRERVVIWVERRPDGAWGVGRAVNPHERRGGSPGRVDFLFEGWELDDALGCANAALEDDVRVLEDDGGSDRVLPFRREEFVAQLEQRFFRGG